MRMFVVSHTNFLVHVPQEEHEEYVLRCLKFVHKQIVDGPRPGTW